MNERVTSTSAALDLLVPPFENVQDDWDDIVRRALGTEPTDSAAGTQPQLRHWFTRPRVLIAATILVILTALVATPAFGVRGLILDLFGRKDVTFNGKIAPFRIRRIFADLSRFVPRPLAPDAIASQTRTVALITANGKRHALWVVPTRFGGYCYGYGGGFTACRARHGAVTYPHSYESQSIAGQVHKELLGISYYERTLNNVAAVVGVQGDVISPNVYSIVLKYANGTEMPILFYYVSKPIDAGFYLVRVPPGHSSVSTRAVAVEARDRNGHLVARQPLLYQTAAERNALHPHGRLP